MVGVLIFLRFTGKSQMANLTPLNSVNTIVLGALVGSILYMPDMSIWVLVFAIFVWTVINILVRQLMRFHFFNRLINGEAEFLIKEGEIDLKMLKRNNLPIPQLRAKLREHEIYSLLDVDQVRFETDGEFTIFRHSEGDESFLLISNGEILKETLKDAERDEQWLKDELNKLGYDKIEDIFCAEYTPDRGFYIIDKDGKIMNKTQKSKVKELRDDDTV